MGKLTKNRKAVMAKYDQDKIYTLTEASSVVKEITFAKFDSSVDVDIRLGVDPKKSDQMVRGVVSLPHGLGKVVRVLVLCSPDKQQEAKDAGAEHVGLDDYIQKIEAGWTDIDVIITMPTVMAKVGKLGKVLGPRGLMPNPKSGTVTLEVGKAVKDVKAGKVDFKIDKQGIIHASVGKASFSAEKIRDNAAELINTVTKLKPASSKGTYLQSISLSSTMSPGIKVDVSSIAG
ncbi:MAG: 50S ribosomal protein L1 [Cyclobacteriaceae bacterium]|nr:50S ribosomal protein L1 [Cyclobacteriaceae bacterium]